MRRLAAAILVAFTATTVAVPMAQADTPRCVSRHEYDRVTKGMTMTKVHKIFDTAGSETGLGAPNLLYHYRPCTKQGLVQVVYSPRGRMLGKSAHWFG
ncbi:hypothetical protein [Nocardioides astragali]|uniref:Uncharacterized protein n=1 Tax=Nocardioides astragali TaxID=1776736 RepID=A0ABW2N657_9ACTN|nr:hypothetical protein [Nocardioides astragali]